jgi:peptide/nickel transport system permease protein
MSLGFVISGSILVEYVFNYPGIGGALVGGVTNRDLPVVQALAMLVAAFYVALNLMADIATILVTPRMRTTL